MRTYPRSKISFCSAVFFLLVVAGCDSTSRTNAISESPGELDTGRQIVEDVIPMEEDPAMSNKVTTVKLDGVPEEFELKGDFLASVAWTDRHGMNALVLSRRDASGASVLTVTHGLREGDASWTTVRTFRERVADCDFDILLSPELGEWTVTDIDSDGLGEATFAYRAGCRSDVSPATHKVILTEDGEKYALRGSSRVDPGGGAIGGEFEADPMFEAAPRGFLGHAEKVWRLTVDERSF